MINIKKILIIFATILFILILISFIFKFHQKEQNIETPTIEIPTEIELTETPQHKTTVRIKKEKIAPPKIEKKQESKTIILPKTKNEMSSVQEPLESQPPAEPKEDSPATKKKLFTYDIKKFSTEPEIIAALKLLEEYGDDEVIKNIQKYSLRVRFDDFSSVMYKRDSYYGMSAYNQYGSRFIMINSIYKTAPAEQLACIIAHESMHTRKSPTLEEEIYATQKEAQCWKNLHSYTTKYPQTKLTTRLNKLIESDTEQLRQQVANTEVYKIQYSHSNK